MGLSCLVWPLDQCYHGCDKSLDWQGPIASSPTSGLKWNDSLSFLLVSDFCLQDFLWHRLQVVRILCKAQSPSVDVWAESNSQNSICLFTSGFAWPTPGNREAEKCQLLNYLFIPQVFAEHLLPASHCARCWERNCEQHRSYGCCGRRYGKDGNFFPFQIYLYTLIFIRTPFRASHHSPHFINHPWVEPQRIQDLLTRKNLSRSSNIN